MSETAERFAGCLQRAREAGYPSLRWLEVYLQRGDEKALQALVAPKTASEGAWIGHALLEAVSPAGNDAVTRRAVAVVWAMRQPEVIAYWIEHQLEAESADGNCFALVAAAAAAAGVSLPDLVRAVLVHPFALIAANGPTSAGRFVLAHWEDHFLADLTKDLKRSAVPLFELLLRDGRAASARAVFDRLQSRLYDTTGLCLAMARYGGEEYRKEIEPAIRKSGSAEIQMLVVQELCDGGLDQFRPLALHLWSLLRGEPNANRAAWLIRHFGDSHKMARELKTIFSWPIGTAAWETQPYIELVALAMQRCPAAAKQAIPAAAENPSVPMRLEAIRWMLKDAESAGTVATLLKKELAGDARAAAKFVPLAAGVPDKSLDEALWKCLEHKSSLLREAAAEELRNRGPAVLKQAAALLQSRQPHTRVAAVSVLGGLNTPEAHAILAKHQATESHGDVRDAIAKVLPPAATAAPAQSPEQVRAQIAAASEKGREKGWSWLDLDDLPPLYYCDGVELSQREVLYLLRRHSRQKECELTADVAALYAVVDRARSSVFATTMLQQFITYDCPRGDAWMTIPVAMLGDHKVLGALATQIRNWAKGYDKKLGEWGARALALNGSETALQILFDLADEYSGSGRTKFRVVGEAAEEALANLAKQRHITIEDLGDQAVPSLGFDGAKPRCIACGKRAIEARIDSDFKLALHDADGGKPVASLPASAPAEVKEEFKGLAAAVKKAARMQATRLENLMVDQHRWSAQRWRELFLTRPLLRPFALRQVWGIYDSTGTLQQGFRMLEDGTATALDDRALDIPADAWVGIVHPLQLEVAARQRWQEHLQDYEITPVFDQMLRPVRQVTASEKPLRLYRQLEGQQVNGLSLRSRLERNGWHGVSHDGYKVPFRRRFAKYRLDALMVTEGVPMFTADRNAQGRIRIIAFAAVGAVVPGELAEKPEDKALPLLSLGEVPPIVFSEVVGDAERFVGKGPG